ncbi:MAG TPA: vanadium-dependent haloperoxidase [Chitinophagaceae bacterium]|nr:vanadium-dependent haloperoxidase [Chitinophagaceae bacterium]
MTTTSLKMKGHSIASFFLAAILSIVQLSSCHKSGVISSNSKQPFSYSSEVLDKWMTLQLRLMRKATGIPNQAFSRHYAYAGIAALESIAPGLPAHANWTRRWNGLTGLPESAPGVQYYYPANVNAAMASINRAFFPNASSADKSAIDSLETALNQEFLTSHPQSLIHESVLFGKAVAAAVFSWADADGYKNAGSPYTAPVGPGLWVPTAPAFANASTPYWGNNRTVITGSIDNIPFQAPVTYSTDPNSAFFQMAKQVYDVSQNLTAEQLAMAIFWRDVPGATSPGHWLSIVQQVVRQTGSSLDKAAYAYAMTGAAINDGLISCWKAKFHFNLVRPITYIRDVMGISTWTPSLTTPPHPECTSAHAVLSVAAGEVMTQIFGNIGSFTDHTYDYLQLAPRAYPNFRAIGLEAAQSRLYAGIHYQPSIDAGINQGKKVAANILSIPGEN